MKVLKQAQQGDMQAFVELFEPLRTKIYAVVCRLVGPHDADDVVMDTFLKAWKVLPTFGGRSSLSTWLCRIAHNKALDFLRRRQLMDRRQVHERDEDMDTIQRLADPAPRHPAAELAAEETRIWVRQALDRLPDKLRIVLLLRFVDDLSYAEIAAATGISLGTVMSRLFNAKRKLRAILKEQSEDDESMMERTIV